jgi:hypothetical protein
MKDEGMLAAKISDQSRETKTDIPQPFSLYIFGWLISGFQTKYEKI